MSDVVNTSDTQTSPRPECAGVHTSRIKPKTEHFSRTTHALSAGIGEVLRNASLPHADVELDLYIIPSILLDITTPLLHLVVLTL